jgi:hypothetical protein
LGREEGRVEVALRGGEGAVHGECARCVRAWSE